MLSFNEQATNLQNKILNHIKKKVIAHGDDDPYFCKILKLKIPFESCNETFYSLNANKLFNRDNHVFTINILSLDDLVMLADAIDRQTKSK